MSPANDQVRHWTGAAPFWETYREPIRQMFAPVTEALVEEARIAPGNSVLDIATGPGEPALDLAALVGPQGKVHGIDIIPEMIDIARRSAAARELANTQFELADPVHLPLPSDSFDAIVSRFGIMFFPAPVDALREALRVLKPGRKLAFAVWHTPESNPLFYTFANAIERYAPAPPLDPEAFDAFRFAAPGKLLALFREAGVHQPSERVFRFDVQSASSPEEFWNVRYRISEKLRERVATLSPEDQASLQRDVLEAMRPYISPSGIRFPAEVRIVSGTKGT